MIGIIDYGAGNLNSVFKAVKKLGYEARIISSPDEIDSVDGYILPGVGAFCQAMEAIEPFKQALLENIKRGKYILGICLGMQMLFDKSYEDGEYEGLGLISGEVKHLEVAPLKVPHMGWNKLMINSSDELADGSEGGYVYFVHSYYACPVDFNDVKLYSEYGVKVPAMVRRDNIIGTQFHPEKSGEAGMAILKKFLEMIQ
ncbi:MAG: imidazole glycerol phosphate synthase subunit HisH [Lachnospiraceae bacterium]|nr:imidazole glycerol phosphate synthase subunit HisH [Lachnospiraceae bacterium]